MTDAISCGGCSMCICGNYGVARGQWSLCVFVFMETTWVGAGGLWSLCVCLWQIPGYQRNLVVAMCVSVETDWMLGTYRWPRSWCLAPTSLPRTRSVSRPPPRQPRTSTSTSTTWSVTYIKYVKTTSKVSRLSTRQTRQVRQHHVYTSTSTWRTSTTSKVSSTCTWNVKTSTSWNISFFPLHCGKSLDIFFFFFGKVQSFLFSEIRRLTKAEGL